ncbi:MAG: zinc metallopeptidase [Clostridia bacterium]|nr:zinc metallopeptidase [Clostridia bacterium]
MFLDFKYIILLLVATVFSVWASIKVNTTFKKYSSVRPASGITGAEAARRVLDANGLYNVRIERIPGNLTDHFDPRSNVIRLSESVYGASSASAIGVAAHEAGHAVQYANGYVPLTLRNAIIPVTNIGSRLAMPLILLGILFASAGTQFIYIAYIGVACFALSTLFQLLTLPTEFNASRRALDSIESSGLLRGEELSAAGKVLSAAALTYVAALAVSLLQLLRLLSIVNSNRRN